MPVGEVHWAELRSRDPASTAAFYSATLGFSSRRIQESAYSVEFGGYEAFHVVPHKVLDPIPPGWLLYVSVADIEASLAGVTAAGGVPLVEVQEHDGMALTTCVLDPAGHCIGLIEDKEHGGFNLSRCAGSLLLAVLVSAQRQRVASFYESVFEWTEAPCRFGKHRGVAYHAGNRRAAAVRVPPSRESKLGVGWMPIWGVDDIYTARDAALDHGAEYMSQVKRRWDQQRATNGLDPENHCFELAEIPPLTSPTALSP